MKQSRICHGALPEAVCDADMHPALSLASGLLLASVSLTLAGFTFSDPVLLRQQTLGEALAFRDELMTRELTVRFNAVSGEPFAAALRLKLAEHPDWIIFDERRRAFMIDESRIRALLSSGSILPQPVEGVARYIEDEGWVLRASVLSLPREGWIINEYTAASLIADALSEGVPEKTLTAEYKPAQLYVQTDTEILRLSRLSRGVSDFAGSPAGRRENVQKALNERLLGVIVQPGKAFSFNNTIKGSVGWKDALIIGEGGKLVPEPGGGICQAATTAFRAAVLAGLPIEKRANHSLYVTYYEKHGVGIDATVYGDKQDFTFRNDTGNPVVIVSRTEGDTAIVELYGVPDGRTVALNGPYFMKTGNDPLAERGKKLRINQIGWTYDVAYPDGHVMQNSIVSTYKALPKRLAEEYAIKRNNQILTANGVQAVAAR